MALRPAGERDARCITIVADITRPADCERIVAQCREVLGGRIDVLCNNAGIAPSGALANCEPAELAAAVACNVHAPMLLSRLVLPDMLRRGGGTIINMSSVCVWCCLLAALCRMHPSLIALLACSCGLVAIPGMAVYCATKAALNSFTIALRAELKVRLGVLRRVLLARCCSCC